MHANALVCVLANSRRRYNRTNAPEWPLELTEWSFAARVTHLPSSKYRHANDLGFFLGRQVAWATNSRATASESGALHLAADRRLVALEQARNLSHRLAFRLPALEELSLLFNEMLERWCHGHTTRSQDSARADGFLRSVRLKIYGNIPSARDTFGM